MCQGPFVTRGPEISVRRLADAEFARVACLAPWLEPVTESLQYFGTVAALFRSIQCRTDTDTGHASSGSEESRRFPPRRPAHGLPRIPCQWKAGTSKEQFWWNIAASLP